MQNNLAFDKFGDFDNGVKLVENALDTFIRDKRIHLTSQKYERIKKLLMVCALKEDFSEDGLTFASVYNFLCEMFEYRKDYEINANAHDEAQEEILYIVASADIKEIEVPVETNRYKRRFVAAIALIILIGMGTTAYKTVEYLQEKTVITVQKNKLSQVITPSQEAEIKSLVWKIVELEKQKGSAITHNAVYNRLKEVESIKAYGQITSYKKFNYSQYVEAKKFLENWILKIN